MRYRDAGATFPLPTGSVSRAAQHHKGNERLPGIILC